MSEAITIAIISFIGILVTSAGTLLGVVITNRRANAEMIHTFDKRQAVFEAKVTEKIDGLRDEVKRYNNVKERTYNLETAQKVVETKVSNLENKVGEMERRA